HLDTNIYPLHTYHFTRNIHVHVWSSYCRVRTFYFMTIKLPLAWFGCITLQELIGLPYLALPHVWDIIHIPKSLGNRVVYDYLISRGTLFIDNASIDRKLSCFWIYKYLTKLNPF
ncbi:MAG: hypothetical protein WB501_09155, partial [Nitrososphaeraceae archaeon]